MTKLTEENIVQCRRYFVCASKERNIWYRYDSHKWVKTEFKFVWDMMEVIKGIIKKFGGKFINKVYVYNFVELGELFYHENFEQILDSNKYLLGFNNGVLDLTTYQLRVGLPEDYISLSTNYDYIEPYPEVMQAITNYVNTLHPNNADQFLSQVSRYLDGDVDSDEKFDYWCSGTDRGGGNGKTKFAELLAKTFGDYFVRLSPNTSYHSLAVLKGKRVAWTVMSETNSVHNIIKSVIGCQSPNAEHIKFKLQANLIIEAVSTLRSADKTTLKRLNYVEWNAQFANQDRYIDRNFDSWRQGLMYLLVNKYYKQNESVRYAKVGVSSESCLIL